MVDAVEGGILLAACADAGLLVIQLTPCRGTHNEQGYKGKCKGIYLLSIYPCRFSGLYLHQLPQVLQLTLSNLSRESAAYFLQLKPVT